jgi:FdrA protein
MKIASIVRSLHGVENAEVMLATEANKGVLSQTQLFTDDVRNAGSNDLVICVMAQDEDGAQEAVHRAEEMLMGGTVDRETNQIAPSINSAMAMLPEANLALISIPGPHVKKEALRALEKGLNLFIFSDNVPVEEEIEIKMLAAERGLLVMGPDCGTAIIHGKALGFANKVRQGSIGLIGASGTGLQEVSVLLHDLGMGISHAIGTGGNDVSDQVGALTMIQGIQLLEADPATEILVVVSKPPGKRTMEKVLNQLKQCSKPVISNFLGVHKKSSLEDNILFTVSLEETALKTAEKMRQPSQMRKSSIGSKSTALKRVDRERSTLKDTQKYVRGLFTGGTLAAEASIILQDIVSPVYGNISLGGVEGLGDPRTSRGHCIIDLGADEFTLGKPHPMIEPEMRRERLLEEAQDPEVAVILLDFVLGYGVHPDPADATIPHLEMARRRSERDGRSIPIVASVCGTDEDPQNKSAQIRMLEECGVIVLPTNAQAVRVAAHIAFRG